MQQMTFFDDTQHSKYINVASVPQRSPFLSRRQDMDSTPSPKVAFTSN